MSCNFCLEQVSVLQSVKRRHGAMCRLQRAASDIYGGLWAMGVVGVEGRNMWAYPSSAMRLDLN